MKAAVWLLAAVLVLGLAGILMGDGIAPWRYSRDLQCGKYTDGRARALCESTERHVVYTCCGHAIVSPGYRSTLETVVSVWCEQGVSRADLAALTSLSGSGDARLRSTAGSLLRLLTGRDPFGHPEAEVSVFNPAHPSYVLQKGCG